jgi:hypothetical protein
MLLIQARKGGETIMYRKVTRCGGIYQGILSTRTTKNNNSYFILHLIISNSPGDGFGVYHTNKYIYGCFRVGSP